MIVVVARDDALSAEELVRFCAPQMADFMLPRYVRFSPRLPKTATERVQKFELRDAGVEGAGDRLAAAANRPVAPAR